MKYRKCEICSFRSERKDGTKRFFMARFPLDEVRCKKWVQMTGNEDLAYLPIEKLHNLKFVCGKHFRDEDFKDKRTQLKRTAIPSIGLTAEPLSDEKLVGFPYHVSRKEPTKRTVHQNNENLKSVKENQNNNDLKSIEAPQNDKDLESIEEPQYDEDLISIRGDVEGDDTLYIPDTVKSEPNSEDEQKTVSPNIQIPILNERNRRDSDSWNRRDSDSWNIGNSDSDDTMRDVKACRACLNNKGVLVNINETHRRIFESACGFVISPDDGYPYYFCVECTTQIKKILAFRRKSRRADFVLKEIMNVRNEVRSTDIATVDRKVTNLVSSLEIWNPQNIYLYTCDKSNEEEDNQLVQQPVKYNKGTIRIQCSEHDIVDDFEETNEFDDGVEDMPVEGNEFDSVDDIVKKLGVDDTEVEKTGEIDLNDVFKGLEEAGSDDETKIIDTMLKPDDIEKLNETKKYDEMMKLKNEEKMKKEKKKRRYKKYKEKIKSNEEQNANKLIEMPFRLIALVLVNFKLEVLSEEEQIKHHEEKWKSEPFKSSLYKCTICIKVFDTVQNLIEHCKEHNQKGKVLCPICRLQLDNEEEKDIHVAERHRYKYTCNVCGDEIYELNLTVQHKCPKKRSRSHNEVDIDSQIIEMFHLIPQSQDDMKKMLETNTGPHHCPFCNMAFTSMWLYKGHCNNHIKTNTGPYRCSVCKMVSISMWLYKGYCNNHIKRDDSNLQCDVCGVYYKQLYPLTKHMDDYHTYTYHCKKCNFEASQKNNALQHLKDHKASEGCPYCSRTSKTIGGMKAHITKWHYKEVFNKVCPLCGVGFRSYVSFYTHQLELHKYIHLPRPPQEPNELTCVHCNMEFKSKRAYETHVLLFEHEEANDIPYTCRPCKKIFDDQESRDIHLLRCPLNFTYPKPCAICGVNINSGVHYHHHYIKKHPACIDYREGKLCDECGRVVTRKRWSEHFCRIKKKPYYCNICDKKLVTSRSYGIHMIYKHTDHPFHCARCPETFKRRIKAKEHILKVHTPVMPYKCPACPRQFSLLQYLNEHALSIHGINLKDDETYKLARLKYSIYIYPDMKLDVSNIDQNKLKEVELQVRDYNDKVIETINKKDYDKYLIFDVKPKEPKIKTRKRKIKIEMPIKPKKKKIVKTEVTESDVLIDPVTGCMVKPMKKRGRRKKNELVKKEEIVEEVILESVEDLESMDPKKEEDLESMDAKKEEIVESLIIETDETFVPENEKEEIVETVIIESGEDIEITEVDGKKYVNFNGVLYYIENQ